MKQARESGPIGCLVLIALGSNATSNWGNPAQTMAKAVDKVRIALGNDARVSPFYATPAFPVGAGPDFVNAAMAVQTALAPADILTILHLIEAEAGRTRTLRWGQRTLDLDLLACGDVVLPDLPTFQHWRCLPPDRQATIAPERLILPHPRVQDRAFVLVPLAVVAPDWQHPVLGQTAAQMRDALPAADIADVRALNG